MAQIDKIYHDLLKDIIENGTEKSDRTGTGTISVFGRQLRYDMGYGFPLLTTKRIHTKSVLYELLWFLSGNTNIKYLKDNGVTIWDEWADENGNLGPIYGEQWRKWKAKKPKYKNFTETNSSTNNNEEDILIDQISNVINTLKKDPDSRRLLVSAWNVGEIEKMALPPCHYSFQFYTRKLSLEERKNLINPIPNLFTHEDCDAINLPSRAISLMWNQRSVDVFLGLPFNIASYAFLLEMFAQQLNMIPEEIICNLGDTHIYKNHLIYVEEQLKRDENKYTAPILKLEKATDIFSYKYEDFKIINYNSYPNWKNVPIAV